MKSYPSYNYAGCVAPATLIHVRSIAGDTALQDQVHQNLRTHPI